MSAAASLRALGVTILAGIRLAFASSAPDPAPGMEVAISFPASVRSEPITGRIFLVVSHTDHPVADLQSAYLDTPQFFGADAKNWKPGQSVLVDGETLGYPLRSINDIPAGDYYVQAFVNIYVEYHRADGHVIWALDPWQGQSFAQSAGNLSSDVQRWHVDASTKVTRTLMLTRKAPAREPSLDDEQVKYIKIQSKLLSKFWGKPIYLGATVLLPRGYASHPNVRYPVIYDQNNHGDLYDRPFELTSRETPESANDRLARESLGYETGCEFYQSWNSERFPRMIAVSLISPTPYYDSSSCMNSENDGPYEDAIFTELIPYIEEHFRIIREPYARVLIGKSSGGREVLALQLFHPTFFGGAWIFYPWSFDFSHYFGLNIYDDQNALVVQPRDTEGLRVADEWMPPAERASAQTTEGTPVFTMRQYLLHDVVMGGTSGVGDEWRSEDAVNGPIGKNGYPLPLWDGLTGVIDQRVAEYWRRHDLADYTQRNWPQIGRYLVGKLHFYVGAMDQWYRTAGVRSFEGVLKRTSDPHEEGHFEYGLFKGHGWQPMTNAELVRNVADYVIEHAPPDADNTWSNQ